MVVLEKLLLRYARHTNARWWIGERPDGRDGQMGRIIANLIGYPTSQNDPFKNNGLVSLDLDQAAHVLAVAGTTSLVHGSYSPRKSQFEDAKEALKELDEDAVFLSNNNWGRAHEISGMPLTTATFECGVIGYDKSRAFIFWVEEED